MTIPIEEVATQRARGKSWPQLGAEYGCNSEKLRGRLRRWEKKNPGALQDINSKNTPDKPIIKGLFPDDNLLDPAALWKAAIAIQDGVQKQARQRLEQVIEIPGSEPFGIALLSDTHFGNPTTDYRQAKQDAETIGRTEGLYAAFHGDGVDNWIVGRLQENQRNQVLGFEGERQLFFNWVDLMAGNWLWFVSGNHDLWSYSLAGIDVFREKLRGVQVLYSKHEVYLTLKQGDTTWRILARHKWRGSSVFNATHGIEVSWERRGLDFDIGIGGHTHQATLCREFIRHNKKRYAIQLGTYKVDGDYGREIGFPEPHGVGCGAMIFFPDGGLHWCRDLTEAAMFLEYLRRPELVPPKPGDDLKC